MPKVIGTRAQRADELLSRLKAGPSFSDLCGIRVFDIEEAARQYRMWAETWIVSEARQLVPELRQRVRSEADCA